MQENSLSFLILELYHPEVDDKCIENVLNVYFMQIYEVNSERNCREFWVSWRFFFRYKVQKSSFHIKRKFAAKSSEISPLLLFIACKNYHWGDLQKGGEAEVITGRAHAYTLFYQLTRPRRRWL